MKTALTAQGFELKEPDLPEENGFIQGLNGVDPQAYILDSRTLSIYVFSSKGERVKGMNDFEEKTHQKLLMLPDTENKTIDFEKISARHGLT